MSGTDTGYTNDIAIIGMAGRFPGAYTIERFWHNLCNGVESVTFFSDEELLQSGISPEYINHPQYVKAKAVLDDIELFDAAFFGFNPREAELMDPQHRLFLEHAWQALEHAGYNTSTYTGQIGLYAGAGMNHYLLNNLIPNWSLLESIGLFQVMLGNDKDYLATRAAYKLNLRGPSISVQTACSTSLVAVHLACQSLLSGESDMALAGGVTLSVPERAGDFYQEGGVVSPDGHCRAFDANAKGSVGGSGVGIVVLKRLADALADGDCIHAVIKGSAVNNDGAAKVGYTAPTVQGQAEVIVEAQTIAGVDPETISYVETHGTGTPLGDPIEVAALAEAFGVASDRPHTCALGSVKTNIGHLDTAAGVAGLIKTVLALKHQQIPPSLHFEQPNPQIDFANSPFYVNTTLKPWIAEGVARRAGVSAFGIGGTNAHVILEEAPPITSEPSKRPWHLLVLSAKTVTALELATDRLADHIEQHPEQQIADIAMTLQRGRSPFLERRVLVCRDHDDAVQALRTRDPKRLLTSSTSDRTRSVVFMLAGLGDQYPDMTLGIYQTEPTFRENVDRCAKLLLPHLELDIRSILYPTLTQPVTDQAAANTATPRIDLRALINAQRGHTTDTTVPLNRTTFAQPALFVIEYALAQLWISWGVQPQAMIGHSLGEYVAACLAGVMSLEDCLFLVAKRAQLIDTAPQGAMVAVPLSATDIQPFLNTQLSVAAVNSTTRLCVLAGPVEAIAAVEEQLVARGMVCQRLPTTHAFHSQMLLPHAAALTALVQKIQLRPPMIPYISNVTGTWITEADTQDPAYWARHMCQTVRFADGMQQLWSEANRVFLEIGPGQSLTTLVLQDHQADMPGHPVLPSGRNVYDQRSDALVLLTALGQLWLSGVDIAWDSMYADEQRYRVSLPTYPFERQRFWIDSQPQAVTPARRTVGKLANISDWFALPSWKQVALPCERTSTPSDQCWVIYADSWGIGAALAEQLSAAGQDVICVTPGDRFQHIDDRRYTLQPDVRSDYEQLLMELAVQGKTPTHIVHSWSLSDGRDRAAGATGFEQAQRVSFYSLLYLTQALGRQALSDPLKLTVVSSGVWEVESQDYVQPEQATLLGLCKVIPQEYLNIACRIVDVHLPAQGSPQFQRLIDQLIAECTVESNEPLIAYRGLQRWQHFYDHIRLPDANTEQLAPLRMHGVYLITGGLGVLGRVLAEELAQRVQARLVLTGRTGLPPREAWTTWLETHSSDDQVSTQIRAVQQLEQTGAKVLVLSADVADEQQMRGVIEQTLTHFGALHGVIHAAGFVGRDWFRPIFETGPDECMWHFRPKVYGLYTLERVLAEQQLDFCLLLSSLSTVMGGLGYSAYAAANSFMDAFARRAFQSTGTRWIAVDWDGMATAEQTKEAFIRIWQSAPGPQIVVSTTDLEANIAKWIKREQSGPTQATPAPTQHNRPALHNPYAAPSNETEQMIAEVFEELLGIKPIGIHDNFFQLGGDSLLGTQMVSRLRSLFQVDIPLRSLFETPTIAEVALVVEAQLIAEIVNTSPEDLTYIVADESQTS